MPPENIIERAFSGGEIAPALYARTDQTKYQQGARTIRNHIVMKHGGLTQRPPTMFVGSTLNSGNQIRLIPFIFNETGIGQSYVLEFGNEYIVFYQNGGVVITAPNTPYKITSPYLQADLANIQYAQTGDVITLVHPNYAPMELTRIAPTNWTLTTIVFGVSISQGADTIVPSGGGSGSLNYSWLVTSVDLNGNESPASGFASSLVNIDQPSPTNPISITWMGPASIPLSKVSFWNIYRANWVGNNFSTYGYVGTVPGTQRNFIDTVSSADFSNTPPNTSPFESLMGPGYYPSTVGFVQQRRCFAAWPNNPIGAAMSKPGSFSNFDFHSGATTPDDDPIFLSIAGEEINSIQHLVELKFMLMLTAGAEIFVQGNGSGVVTPSAINAATQSQYGSSSLKVLKVGDVLLFNQALGSFIRDFVFDFVIDGYRGNDITMFSSHLFEGHQIVDWAYQKTPDSIIWAVREDGILLSCTYVREQQILAWARHDFTNGFVENVVSIPENGEYAVYVCIRRVINGSTVRYIERMSSRIWQGPAAAVAIGAANALGDPIDASFCDSFAQYDGRNTGNIGMVLNAPVGGFKTDGTAYQQQIVLTCFPTNFFTPQMVGDQIFLQDSMFVSSQGQQGFQIRCTIQSYASGNNVTITPSGPIPVEFQVIEIFIWSHAVQTISGLTYLAGQQVSVWADHFVVGSPLNKQISTVYTVPSNGILTLDKCYSVIYVGLPMVADLETLAIDTSFGDSIMGERKAISRLTIYIYNTRGFFGGTQNPDTDPDNLIGGVVQDPLFNLTENKAEANRQFYSSPLGLMTEWQVNNVDCNWSKEGRIFIRNVDPVPLAILAVVPAGLTSAKQAWAQKV